MIVINMLTMFCKSFKSYAFKNLYLLRKYQKIQMRLFSNNYKVFSVILLKNKLINVNYWKNKLKLKRSYFQYSIYE